MFVERRHSRKKVGVQCLLLALPTALFAFLMFYRLNSNYPVLQRQWIYQGCYFALGIFASIIFYGWRFRFISTAALLALLYFLGYKLLGKMSAGEFDVFFFSVQYIIFIITFSLGWLVGLGFSRWHIFTVIWTLLLLGTEIILISKIETVTASVILLAFTPILLYTFYIIYTSELVRNLNEHQASFGWFLTKRISGFSLITIFILLIVFLILRKDLIQIEYNWKNVQPNYSEAGKNSQNMTKTNQDGTLSNNGQMPLGGSLTKTKQLVFVAHLDNPFPGTGVQNPLYFTADYYTRFDSVTQTFATDSLMPSNDLFSPDPSKIPLFFTKSDSSVIKNSQATLNRKIVETEVYKVALSPSDYLAPNTAFSVQPIPVPKEYGSQYTSAFRAKMWVSDLNSAYFVYNPAGNEDLENFQKERFDILRNDTDYSKIGYDFLQYYTSMPQGEAYRQIARLAQKITAGDSVKTTIDKIIAVRNYFLSKDEFGQPLFQYTDNPGEPGLPNANKLDYFLFENRKGYCAYFAGATLFMLRALHIPARIATGFLTIDRTSKNPGWYWFYEDQAHAWVQVFFPQYGWIDFDTTIPDVNTIQAPQPDGTPPLGTQKVYFAGDGTIQNIDTSAKQMNVTVNKILYRDKNFTANKSIITIPANIAFARFSADTGLIKISDLRQGMHVTIASYDEKQNHIEFINTEDTAAYILNQLIKPVSIDEVKVIEQEEKNKKAAVAHESVSFDWIKILISVLTFSLLFVIIIVAAPWIIWQYYKARSYNIQNTNTAVLYYLNQLGYHRENLSPQGFAQKIDDIFKTELVQFNQLYQKEKYSNNPLNEDERLYVNMFYHSFMRKIKNQISRKKRVKHFLNLSDTLYFFIKQ